MLAWRIAEKGLGSGWRQYLKEMKRRGGGSVSTKPGVMAVAAAAKCGIEN